MKVALPRQSQVFFFLILASMLFLTWIVFRPFVIFMLTGIFVAVLARPIDRFFERRMGHRLAAFLTIMVLFLIITLPLVLLGLALFNDAREVADSVQNGEIESWIDQGLDIVFGNATSEARNATERWIDEDMQPRLQSALQSMARTIISGIDDFFIGTTVILFVVYYVLTDGNRLVNYIRRAAPLPHKQVDFLLVEANNGLHAVFVGQILTSLIQGSLGGIGFLIAGLPGAVLWAAVMAVLSLLPVVGAFLVWVPASIYLLLVGDLWQGIFLLAWGGVVVSQVDNFLRPRLIGSRANIHPIFVLVGVLGGVAAFGFIGLFLGPLLVGVTISVLRVWEAEYLDPSVGTRDPTAPRIDLGVSEPRGTLKRRLRWRRGGKKDG